MTTKKLPLHLKNTSFSLYGNLGERIAAGFLDGVFLTPVTLGSLYFNSLHLYHYYYTFAITQLVIMAYGIYLPVRYGATPGKRVMGLTILQLDGSAISYRESFLKHLPMLIISLLAFVVQGWAISLADEAAFDRLNWVEQSNYLQSFYPFPMWMQMAVIYGYYFATLLLVLMNPRHRSVSDYLAGTVVVYSRCLEKIKGELEITS
ncbi:RDD family protein [Flavobacterium sp. UBA7682]|uniref:RDD family protein n=1 Tax=Flavobacterium sp. UBA7682 TaxID=1946560 RepID=UPI0025BC64FF|nr:RDD family protein [Flavobacterium sp. UBA7682]